MSDWKQTPANKARLEEAISQLDGGVNVSEMTHEQRIQVANFMSGKNLEIERLTSRLVGAIIPLHSAAKQLTVRADEVGDAERLEINCDKSLLLVKMALAHLKDIEND